MADRDEGVRADVELVGGAAVLDVHAPPLRRRVIPRRPGGKREEFVERNELEVLGVSAGDRERDEDVGDLKGVLELEEFGVGRLRPIGHAVERGKEERAPGREGVGDAL